MGDEPAAPAGTGLDRDGAGRHGPSATEIVENEEALNEQDKMGERLNATRTGIASLDDAERCTGMAAKLRYPRQLRLSETEI